jgi:hypothetical protein
MPPKAGGKLLTDTIDDADRWSQLGCNHPSKIIRLSFSFQNDITFGQHHARRKKKRKTENIITDTIGNASVRFNWNLQVSVFSVAKGFLVFKLVLTTNLPAGPSKENRGTGKLTAVVTIDRNALVVVNCTIFEMCPRQALPMMNTGGTRNGGPLTHHYRRQRLDCCQLHGLLEFSSSSSKLLFQRARRNQENGKLTTITEDNALIAARPHQRPTRTRKSWWWPRWRGRRGGRWIWIDGKKASDKMKVGRGVRGDGGGRQKVKKTSGGFATLGLGRASRGGCWRCSRWWIREPFQGISETGSGALVDSSSCIRPISSPWSCITSDYPSALPSESV